MSQFSASTTTGDSLCNDAGGGMGESQTKTTNSLEFQCDAEIEGAFLSVVARWKRMNKVVSESSFVGELSRANVEAEANNDVENEENSKCYHLFVQEFLIHRR